MGGNSIGGVIHHNPPMQDTSNIQGNPVPADTSSADKGGGDDSEGFVVCEQKNIDRTSLSDDFNIVDERDMAVTDKTDTSLLELCKKSCKRPSDGFISSIFRKVMGVLHTVFGFGKITSTSKANVEQFARLRTAQRGADGRYLGCANADAKVVTTEVALIAAANGVKRDAQVKPFSDQKDSALYPSGTPKLADIKQNPRVQDCWFLSTLAAILRSQGAGGITSLIEEGPDDTYLVHLRGEKYAVPKGDVCDKSGKRLFDGGAPWVRVLETAMQAYRLAKCEGEPGGAAMIYQSPLRALEALMGKKTTNEINEWNPPKTNEDVQKTAQDLKNKLDNGWAVVLGHVKTGSSVGAFLKGAARDGISPDHAVAVLDIQLADENNKKPQMTILDPYGQVKIVSTDMLTRCAQYTMRFDLPKGKQAQASANTQGV